MKKRALRLLKIYVVIGGIGLAYATWISMTGIGIPCIIRKLTGFRCPGCGISHMCMELLKGHLEKAYRCNRMVFLLLPVLLFEWARYLFCYIKSGVVSQSKIDRILIVISIISLILWGIVRNFPGYEYLN